MFAKLLSLWSWGKDRYHPAKSSPSARVTGVKSSGSIAAPAPVHHGEVPLIDPEAELPVEVPGPPFGDEGDPADPPLPTLLEDPAEDGPPDPPASVPREDDEVLDVGVR